MQNILFKKNQRINPSYKIQHRLFSQKYKMQNILFKKNQRINPSYKIQHRLISQNIKYKIYYSRKIKE